MTATAATPPQPSATRAEESFSRALKLSLIGHGALAFFILFKTLVFPSKPKPYVPTLRVDMVGLPDVLKKDLTKTPTASDKEIAEALKRAEVEAKKIKPIKMPKAPEEPVEPAAKNEMVLKPKQTAQDRGKKLKSALDRIKALSKINAEVSEEKAASKVVKGNMISKGTSLSGDAKESAEANYLDSVRDKLQENWALPVWIARQNLSAQIQIYIDPYGRVRRHKLVKPSGNEQFDAAIQKTLEDSQPFPAPPEDIAASLLSDGILVGFPL